MMNEDGRYRCFGSDDDPVMRDYHDLEWGVPIHDDRHLFELLCLEGAQAGLSWRTVLHRREGYRLLLAETPESQAMSKALKEGGFNFVGPTICYAYTQSAGMVNDHVTRCFRHDEV
jgi:3-methyladenine DNA glycosylase Tag